MSLGYTYTMIPSYSTDHAAMTGHATTKPAAQRCVEQLLARDQSLFCGIVRDLDDSGAAFQCLRSRRPGSYVWIPFHYPAPLTAASADLL